MPRLRVAAVSCLFLLIALAANGANEFAGQWTGSLSASAGCGNGTVTSSKLNVRPPSSQRTWLGPMTNSSAEIDVLRRPRSVIAQRLREP